MIDGDKFLAYANASGTEYNIPNGITVIGNRAFHSTHLTNVAIPDGVTSIEEGAFYSCRTLREITIPESVISIKHYAFYGCGKLSPIYCKPTTPPTLGSNYVFDNNASGRKIYVPVGSGDAYKSANYWNEYAADIVETTF